MRLTSVLFSLTAVVAASGAYAQQSHNGFIGAASTFSIENKTQVPGETLKPGQYSIQVTDQMLDRMLIRVENESTKDHAIFLGVPQPQLAQAGSTGPVDWKNGLPGEPALRGFEFSSGEVVEFVYPKSEAVELAKRNDAKVVAIDPESEGLPVLKNLSKEDMKVVSLWALALTTTGTDNKTPAIAAQKYQGVPMPSSQPVTAQASSSVAPQRVASMEAPKMNEAASLSAPKRAPVVAKLPHTASPVALIALCGMLFLTAGGLLRLRSMNAATIEDRG